jgi:hypothetical protein
VVAGKSPKYEKTMPEIYEPGELKAFFKSLRTDYDQLFFDVLLKTGLRGKGSDAPGVDRHQLPI